MGLIEPIERCLSQVSQNYRTSHPTSPLRLLSSRPETIWSKFDHLLYLPLLNLERPRDLYWEQGAGLEVLYGFTYKYLPVEQFLGQLTRLGLGSALIEPLARSYSQAWYPGSNPLVIFSDWHVKPHWTKHLSQSGSVTMVGRVMPGTKQLFINGLGGHMLAAWNEPIDAHFSRVLLERETQLATMLNRSLSYNVLDSEGGGLPLAQQYQQAEHWYLSILPRGQNYQLSLFHLLGDWQAVADDPEHEAIEANWADEQRVATDPRRLILLRPVGGSNPTRIYTGHIPPSLTAAVVPACHRQRWVDQECRFREMIAGANLNTIYGYRYQLVPHRTRQRQWQAAQEQVERSQNRLLEQKQAIRHLQTQLQHRGQIHQQFRADLLARTTSLELQLQQRQQVGQKTGHLQRSLGRCQRQLIELQQRHRQRWHKLYHQLCQQCQQAYLLQQRLADQEANRDAIDTDTLCRERQLEKDQIMLNWQVMLTHLHDWACHSYFAPAWQNLEVETASRVIYRKAGRVSWLTNRIEVTLDSYRYPEHQQAMEISCHRFNQANLRWRDGRLLRIYVDKPT
jgi:hypothetical protein